MINSMTGYGKGAAEKLGRAFSVEIKAVNHRYGEVGVKLPRVMNAYEDRVKAAVLKAAARGKIDVYIRYETTAAADARLALNTALLDAYAAKLAELRDRYYKQGFADDLSLSLLARLPEAIAAQDAGDEDAAALWPVLEEALAAAISAFSEMRAREGAALERDLRAKGAALSRLRERACERAPGVAADYRARLEQKVRELLGGAAADEGRLLTEVTIYADKTAVDEELTRLESHLAQFRGILDEGGAVGRKLDFLIQELNREANTIASKANDIALGAIAVEMKGEIEKIREQAQNVE